MNKLNYKALFIFFVLMPCLVGISVFYFVRYNAGGYLRDKVRDKKIASSTEEVLTRVGELMVLPVDEKAAIATISDVGKLKNQEFFQRAENGYKVIIYQVNRRAILYSPLDDKIIEVSSINLSTNSVDIEKITK